ncbi:hypothetical protein OG762_48700 (plasmid) [Streptomyces sp. NBC_01136]|uniref:hypothetical protein n=1 Tax=unclassified Streptomyces TaxID=2593676 RepID=UPI002F916E95|nr:hypothetical protein OG762_48700 [Streptomyces sp. NBC_01136]
MTPDELFDGIAADLAPRGVTTGILFGKRALKAHDKAFACLLGDNLAFKLGEGTPAHAEALALRGAELFDPSFKNHPFKDWVAVPERHAKQWPNLAEAAMNSLPS